MSIDHEHWYLPSGLCITNVDEYINIIMINRDCSSADQEKADSFIKPLISFLLQAHRGYSPNNTDLFDKKASCFFSKVGELMAGETPEEKIESSIKALVTFLSEECKEKLRDENGLLGEICEKEYTRGYGNTILLINEIGRYSRELMGEGYSNYPYHVAVES